MSYSVFLGDVALDEYYSVDQFPPLGTKVMANQLPAQLGGMIANAACVFAAYGPKTRFLSVLNSRDKKLCDQLETVGIDTSLVLFDDSLADSKCMIFLSQEEHTVFIIEMGQRETRITPDVQEELCGAELIYSTYNELNRLRMDHMSCTDIVAQWKSRGVRLACDVDVAALTGETSRFLPYTDLLFMNKVGFENQRKGKSEDEAVRALLRAGVKTLVVTLAEDGCAVYETAVSAVSGAPQHYNVTRIPGVPADVTDVTGAGDTFCSTFSFLYTRTNDAAVSGTFANYAASRSVTQLGARGGACGAEPVYEYMEGRGASAQPFRQIITKIASQVHPAVQTKIVK